jgi:iron complex outermembrane receptor protein
MLKLQYIGKHLQQRLFRSASNGRNGHLRAITLVPLLVGTVILLSVGTLRANDSLTYLKSLKIEELLDIEITSVSKKSEKLADAPAAVFVISADDIRRAGARSIPEALRLAPGIQVSQIDASKWAISSRGFNDIFSNKLLVLVDGRSVYTPMFSGVLWDAQDILMADIDRIEIIRGPGAALWGANAVNGVINIITKSAKETQDSLVSIGAGSHEAYNVGARYGNKLDQDGAFRIYAKGFKRGTYEKADGQDANDQWDSARSGFRMDLDLNPRDAVMFQGDIYEGTEDQMITSLGTLTMPSPDPQKSTADFFGGDFLTRWNRELTDTSNFSLQFYYDHSDRDQVILKEIRNTVDLDFQHRFQFTGRQEVIWGLGYRLTWDDTEAGPRISMNPESRSDRLYSAFLQDEVTLQPDKWWLTLGSKFEHNDYTGFELQPSMRLRWKPKPRQIAWAAISRAVRTPARSEHDVRYNVEVGSTAVSYPPYSIPTLTTNFGDDDFKSEELTAYELGYRWQPKSSLSFDLATFYNQYDNLRTGEPDTAAIRLEDEPPPPHILIPIFMDNKMKGETYGFEWLAVWRPLTFWKLTAGYTYLQMDLRTDSDSLDTAADDAEGDSPANQIQLCSNLDLPKGWSLDAELYYVDKLSKMDIPAYTRLDLRVGWQPTANWELSLNAENLLDDRHPEFGESYDFQPSQIPRQIYGQIILRY